LSFQCFYLREQCGEDNNTEWSGRSERNSVNLK